jgi:hypothetical protein
VAARRTHNANGRWLVLEQSQALRFFGLSIWVADCTWPLLDEILKAVQQELLAAAPR